MEQELRYQTQQDDAAHEMEWQLSQRISDKEWMMIAASLTGVHGKNGNARRFVEGVMWVAQTGALWTHLPPEYGLAHSVYVRFLRWVSEGKWEGVLEGLENPRQQSDLKGLIARHLGRKRAEAMAKRLRAGSCVVVGSRGLG